MADQNGQTFDASEISLTPPKKGAASPSPSGQSGQTFNANEISLTPPKPAPLTGAAGFFDRHPTISNAIDTALGWANRNIAEPEQRVAGQVTTALKDIPKAITEPHTNEDYTTPFTSNLSANPDVRDLSAIARRGGRVAGDLFSAVAAPFSAATAPPAISQPIQKLTTLPASGNPDVDAVVNPILQTMLFHGLSEGARPAPTELAPGVQARPTPLDRQVTTDRTKAVAPATRYEMEKQAEPQNRGLSLPAGQYAMPESSLAQAQRQKAIDTGQKVISNTLADVHARQGMGALEDRVQELQREVRQQDAREKSRAAVDEQLTESARNRAGIPQTQDVRAIAPTPEELSLPNRTVTTPQPPAQTRARIGAVPPIDENIKPEGNRPPLVELPKEQPAQELARSSAPAGLVMPLEPGRTAEDILPNRGAAGVRGQYQQVPAFGAEHNRDLANDLIAHLKADAPEYDSKVVGSVAEKGKSAHDLDLHLEPNTEDFDFQKVIGSMEKQGYEYHGPTGPIDDPDRGIDEFRNPKTGHIIDIFTGEPPKSSAQDAAEKAGATFVGEKNGLAELKLPNEMTRDLPIDERFKDHVSVTLPAEGITPEKISDAMNRKVSEMGGTPNVPTESPKETTGDKNLLSSMHAGGFLNPTVWRQAFPSLDDSLKRYTSTEKLTPGLQSKTNLRAAMGTANRDAAIAKEQLSKFRDQWNKVPEGERIASITREQRGQAHPDPQHAAFYNNVQDLFQKERVKIETLGAGAFDFWRENYFPQMWKKPGEVRSLLAKQLAKKPLEGTRAFTKERVFDDILTGILAGKEPVTTNPVDLALMKINEMQKYRMAHKSLSDDLINGNAIHVPFGQKRPGYASSWVKLDDRIGTTNRQGNITTSGNFYLPPDAAKIYNNYLSPGLKGNKYYDAVRGFGNAVNQAQLGISAFHATTTAFNTIASDMSLALEHGAGAVKQVSKGNIGEAAKETGRAVGAGARAVTGVPSIASGFVEGYKANKEYKSPGSYPRYASIAKAMERANATPELAKEYRTGHLQSMREALNDIKDGNILKGGGKALVHSVPAVFQAAAWPIMEKIVPTLKSGAFAHMARVTLDRAQKEGWDEMRTNRELQKVQNSIDARFGQVNPDNIFVNKMAKDIAYIAVRSAGWTGGTISELGGGIIDAAKQAARAGTLEKPEMTHRMAYTLALPITAAIYGGYLHYAFTGRAPDKLRDYYIVPDDKGNYFNLPTYMKDVLNISNDPVRTLASKAHPLGQQVTDLIRNENYQGEEIYRPDDPIAKQAYDSMKYMLKDTIPFSIQNALKIEKGEGKFSGKDLLGYAGVTPAPKWQTLSPAGKEIMDYNRRYGGQGVRTQEQFEHSDLMHQLRDGLDKGTKTWDDVLEQLDAGKLSQKEVKELYHTKDLTPLQRSFSRISDLNEAVKIWNKADEDEKKDLEPLMRKKYKALQSRSEEEKERVAPLFDNFLEYENK